MSKMITSPKLVIKINSARLRRSNWHVELSVTQARENNELISMNESQILRWLDELNGIKNAEQSISYIKDKIRALKYNPDIKKTQRGIKYWFDTIDSLLFKQDYVCVIIDKAADYQALYKDGFYINDICYRRLLGTTGGVKNSTIVFVNEKHREELKKRIANGRDLTKEFSPAKLEAYQSLVCSASTPVSLPKGICVVPDCITHFKSDYILLDDTNVSQPKMIEKKAAEIELNDSDGYGLGMPSLMKRWGSGLKENYILSGCVIRNSFLKGAAFCVDFQKFAAARNIKYIRDVWGAWHPVKNIELIVTTSMLKLWDSYPSIYVYLQNCKRNHYSFAITKAAEENLENERCMNYQFLQSYDFTDEDIEELIQPTIAEIKDILSGDYRKTILYAKGKALNAKNAAHLDPSFSTALMIDERMKNDPYVKAQIQSMITKRINNAKVGVLTVPANYSLVSGDPYSLCQSMFGLPVTGLLKEKEVYCNTGMTGTQKQSPVSALR